MKAKTEFKEPPRLDWDKRKNTQPLSFTDLLQGMSFGRMQSVGFMQMIPLVKPGADSPFISPVQAQVQAANMGVITFENPTDQPMLIPTHAAYVVSGPFQDQAMTHGGILAPGETRTFDTAACVQAYEPGLIPKGSYTLNFLPFPVREIALSRRTQKSLSKLYYPLTALNKKYRLRRIGRLRYFLNHFKPQLDQFVAEFEYVKDQVGAIVMLEGRIVGIEIAPSHQYWQEIWMPLLRECYGSLVLEYRHYMGEVPSEAVMKLPFSSKMTTLADLRAELTLLRQLEEYAREDVFKDALSDVLSRFTEETVAGHTLETVYNRQFIGQIVHNGGELHYASLVARTRWYQAEILKMTYMPERTICLVCGYDKLAQPPYVEGSPSYERCPCCQMHYGYDDYVYYIDYTDFSNNHHGSRSFAYGYAAWRYRWIAGGYTWHNPHLRPKDWGEDTMRQQLQNILNSNVTLGTRSHNGWNRPYHQLIEETDMALRELKNISKRREA